MPLLPASDIVDFDSAIAVLLETLIDSGDIVFVADGGTY